MQIEIQEMFLLFMKQLQHAIPIQSKDKNACFVFLHKAQNAAMKAIEIKY